MEINFEHKSTGAYREVSHQIKRVQESAESVVPDTNDDIGRIASVQSSVLLKSKDVTGRGVTVTGEITTALLYITESESGVAALRLTKSFEMEYELGEVDADTVAQIHLAVTNTEARVLNPRKVSVTVELSGELSCYRPESIRVETALPAEAERDLHLKVETAEAVVVKAVCEKTFAVNEQYVFPGGKPVPAQLVFQRSEFCVTDTESVGSRMILRGELHLTVGYLSNEAAYPLTAEFTSPFSQIVDLGEEELDGCSAVIELTSAYYDLIETINGEKALDAELHAVVQLAARRRQSVSYVSDAYSNRMPAQCSVQGGQISTEAQLLRSRLSAAERLEISEDCEDVLCVFSGVSQAAAAPGKLSASVALDIVYRSREGSLSCARRLVNLEGEGPAGPARLLSARLSEAALRPEGGALDCRLAVELSCLSGASAELARVESVSLDEEAAYDLSRFPTVTLVRVGQESLWELAKRYHSSVESIQALNDLTEGLAGRLLLVPKEL